MLEAAGQPEFQTTIEMFNIWECPEMIEICRAVRTFLRSEDGPTAVEYAVMLAMIIIVCVAGISSLGSNTSTHFTDVSNYLT